MEPPSFQKGFRTCKSCSIHQKKISLQQKWNQLITQLIYIAIKKSLQPNQNFIPYQHAPFHGALHSFGCSLLTTVHRLCCQSFQNTLLTNTSSFRASKAISCLQSCLQYKSFDDCSPVAGTRYPHKSFIWVQTAAAAAVSSVLRSR